MERDFGKVPFGRPPTAAGVCDVAPNARRPLMKIRLTITAGPHAGKEFTFDRRDSFLVGRAKDAHFRLSSDDPYFSRKHFVLEIDPPLCRLLDLKSRNGVLVNGKRVEVCDLANGDEIRAGHTTFRVAVEQDAIPTLDVPDETPSHRRTMTPADAERLESLMIDWLARANTGEDVSAEGLCPADAAHLLEPLREGIEAQRRLRQAWREAVKSTGSASRGPRGGVPGYELLEELGRGGMGVVYKATRLKDNTPAAVKVITPAATAGSRQIHRILRESRILGELAHEHVVRFYEAGEADGGLFIAMEFVDGPDAGKLIERFGPQPVTTAARILRQALAGLAHAHQAGYVHRDIKPSNLLLGRAGGARVVKVADFGLARAFETSRVSGLTLNGDIGGTPAFMPPEQVTHYRDVTPAADQYAAAATLYYLLTAKYAFDFPKDAGGKLVTLLTASPIPIRDRRSDIPAELAKVIHKAMAREPEDRFRDVIEFRAALKPFANQPQVD